MSNAIISASSLFLDRSPRWVNDSCRAGRIAGAFKIGGSWFVREAAIERIGDGGAPAALSVDDAAADLRARGVL